MLSIMMDKTQKRSYLKPQGVSEGLSTLILKEILRGVFLDGSGSVPAYDLEPQTISEALVAAQRTKEFWKIHW